MQPILSRLGDDVPLRLAVNRRPDAGHPAGAVLSRAGTRGPSVDPSPLRARPAISLLRFGDVADREFLGYLQALPAEDIEARLDSLTDREFAILSYIASGLCNKEIGGRMGIEVTTIKSHVGSIFKKLGINNRVKAAIFAVWVFMMARGGTGAR